jgi:hypothetical protein
MERWETLKIPAISLLAVLAAACGSHDVVEAGGQVASVGEAVSSPTCPGNDGTCNDGMVCVSNQGIFSCVAPPGGNVCPDGTKCAVTDTCGTFLVCDSEGGPCSFPCFAGDTPVPAVYDIPVGGRCETVDVHQVTHVCNTMLCSNSTPSTCLATSPPPGGGGDG